MSSEVLEMMPRGQELRQCTSCPVIREVEHFRTGRSVCKFCEAAGSKARRLMAIATNPKAYWWRRSVQAARFRSKRKGYTDFELKEDKPIDMPAFCPILGWPLNYGQADPTFSRGLGVSPSIDQVIPWEGYKYDNVRVISARANTMKSCGTLGDHIAILKYMNDHVVDLEKEASNF